jgi:Mn-dependent DtxR family transcriptional regulator/Fe2+ transport system protein FeoA
MNDLLKMYKEDLLRATLEFGRETGEIEVTALLADVEGEPYLFERAILDLEKESLITRKGGNIILTPVGREVAEKIYAKHRFIEEYFQRVFNESDVHILAHALEHCVSDSILAKMKGELALTSETRNLSDLKNGEEAVILAIAVHDKKLFSRLLGLGFTPGAKIRLFEKLQSQLVVDVEGRKIALDTLIADKVLISIEDRGKKT